MTKPLYAILVDNENYVSSGRHCTPFTTHNIGAAKSMITRKRKKGIDRNYVIVELCIKEVVC